MKGLATLALVLATGCGEVVKNNNDADGDMSDDADGDTDADGDNSEPDAPPAPVATRFRALSFNRDGLPEPNATFFVTDSSGAVIGTGPTDSDGYFTLDLIDEVTVTLVRKGADNGEELRYELETLLGVKPGDDIVFGLPAAPSATITATMEAYAPTMATLTTPCFSQSTNVDGYLKLEFTDACHGSTFEVFGYAGVGRSATYFYADAQPFMDSGLFDTPAFTRTVQPFTMTLVNMPLTIGAVAVGRSTLVGARSAYSAETEVELIAPTDTVDLALTYPPVVGLRSETNVTLNSNVGPMVYLDEARHADGGPLHIVDFNERLLPIIDSVTIDLTGIQWTESANTGMGDAAGAIAFYSWTDETQRQVDVAWRVIGPTLTSPLALPAMSASFGVPNPADAIGVVNTFGGVIGIEVDRVATYDELRPNFEVFLYTTDTVEGLYPGEGFTMRRTQATTNTNNGIARQRGGMLLPLSAADRRGAHAGQ